jgi:hypothetical protein
MATLSAKQQLILGNFQRGAYRHSYADRGDGWVSLGGRACQTAEALARRGLLELQPGSGGVYRLTDAGRRTDVGDRQEVLRALRRPRKGAR